jgi:hypothetical protein
MDAVPKPVGSNRRLLAPSLKSLLILLEIEQQNAENAAAE